jgi:isopenicillin-N epimerase
MAAVSDAMREPWTLDPNVVFLNHGSFGACPRPVLEAQSALRAELEREPVDFMLRRLEGRMAALRSEVSAFVGARPEDIAFVRNSTAGVSAVLASLTLGPGDALLTTDHAYGACKNALDFFARRAGAEVIVAHLPFPPGHPGEVVERVLARATPRVKLALIDHVTSPTGLVMPIATLVRELRERGIETLVDGAHAPGMVPMALTDLGAAYYVGNFHKWVCAPKGAAMLWVRADRQRELHPTVISHGLTSTSARSRFLEEFDWTGSDDPTPWLVVPDAIRCVGGLVPGGWPEVQRRNRALALEARRILVDALDLDPGAPESMVGSMAALVLPGGGAAVPPNLDPLHAALFERHRIEVPVFRAPDPSTRVVRISAQLYNTRDDYEALAMALRVELGDTRCAASR